VASTYSWDNVLTFVKPYVASIPTGTLDVLACDRVNRIMWRAAPFRWTQANITAVSLTDTAQDYALTDTNLYRLLRARITRTDISPNLSSALDILEWLEPTLEVSNGMYAIRACSMIATTSTVRMDVAVSVPSGVAMSFRGEYQIVPSKVTTTTGTIIAFPDDYIDCAIEGLKWVYMVLAKDVRAGGANTTSKGDRVFTGQYATFMALLDEMKEAEQLGNEQGQRFPESPLGVGRQSSANLFGWG